MLIFSITVGCISGWRRTGELENIFSLIGFSSSWTFFKCPAKRQARTIIAKKEALEESGAVQLRKLKLLL
jgi:hypothetical protein